MDTNAPAAAPEKKSRFGSLILAGMILLGLIAAWSFLPLDQWIEAFRQWAESLGPAGWIVFALIYAVAVFFLIPGSLLTLAAGVAFGLWGFPIVVTGATLGASMAFLAGRYLFRERVSKLFETRPRLRASDSAIGREGWRIVALLRLSPVVPFSLQNWALGGTPVSFRAYFPATLFGIMPGTLLYVWIGSLGAAAGSGGAAGPARTALLVLGLIATGATVWLVSRKARRILQSKDEQFEAGA